MKSSEDKETLDKSDKNKKQNSVNEILRYSRKKDIRRRRKKKRIIFEKIIFLLYAICKKLFSRLAREPA